MQKLPHTSDLMPPVSKCWFICVYIHGVAELLSRDLVLGPRISNDLVYDLLVLFVTITTRLYDTGFSMGQYTGEYYGKC